MSTETYDEIKSLTATFNIEFERFHAKKIKVAATRCRILSIQIEKLNKQLRKELLDERKSLPTKAKTKAPPSKSKSKTKSKSKAKSKAQPSKSKTQA